MGRMSHRNQERTERRISAAASLMLCALTVLAQIAVTLLLTRFLKGQLCVRISPADRCGGGHSGLPTQRQSVL